jgi:ankyrin repeat protein
MKSRLKIVHCLIVFCLFVLFATGVLPFPMTGEFAQRHRNETVHRLIINRDYDLIEDAVRSDPDCLNRLNRNGLSPLHFSLDRKDFQAAYKIVAIAKAHPVDLNLRAVRPGDKLDGYTALHFASSICHKNLIKELIALGASKDVVDANGLTPADLLKKSGCQ